ncbi:hypothetical protein ACFSGX_15535 [Sphingomonas arantia]|uniref:Uncharacterized protein n=1 Tax=Sphingomonas arantia TaxID=1460676 RepID=A0ABW4U350_9SPHN
MHRIAPRLAGLALVAASCGTTWVHRSIWDAAHNGPAQAAELGIGLLTFMLASAGVLLLIHGVALFGRTINEAPPATPDLIGRLLDPITPAGRAYDTRRGVAMMQTRRTRMAGLSPTRPELR